MEPYHGQIETQPRVLEWRGAVRRLFADYKEVEQEYYRKTRIFPIMHTVAIRRGVYEQNRWVAQSLYKAFVEAQRRTYEDLYMTAALKAMLPWLSRRCDRREAPSGCTRGQRKIACNDPQSTRRFQPRMPPQLRIPTMVCRNPKRNSTSSVRYRRKLGMSRVSAAVSTSPALALDSVFRRGCELKLPSLSGDERAGRPCRIHKPITSR
jgi:hypothetical protein